MCISYILQQEELCCELCLYFVMLMMLECWEVLSLVQGEYGVGNVYWEMIV